MSNNSLLSIENLKVYFSQEEVTNKVIDGISLEISQSEIVALVGGSGSGKTITGLSILRLLPLGAKIIEGKIIFQGSDLLKISENQIRQIRGKEISMVFQEPLSAFNPLFTIGFQINEVLQLHTDLGKRERRAQVLDLLKSVGIPNPQKIISDYPHQLSGGLRQRAMIAQALAGKPKLIIADEPTSNLDVTLQAQIMELFRNLSDELKISILLISHDLAMVAHLAKRVAIICGGKVVESGDTKQIWNNPRHPFTQQLMEAVKT